MSIKVDTTPVLDRETWLKPMEISLQGGLIGFSDLSVVELIFNPEELPFMWLRAKDEPALNFIVMEPGDFVPGYTVELAEDDAAQLAIERPDQALVLNLVTFRPDHPESATVNLIGPIVVNRQTYAGRQVIVTNFADYSARHPLLPQEPAER